MDKILSHILSDSIKNIIVDCDTGADGDDQFALAYALASVDKVRVLGVLSEPFNEDAAAMATAGEEENREIISVSGRNIPTAVGSGDYVTRCGGAVESAAAEFIKNTAEKTDGQLYVVMSGCCTNTASALMKYPHLKDKIVAVWLAMADIYGEETGQEYNFQNDPIAGQYIFNCGVPLVLIPTKLIYPFAATKDEIDARFGNKSAMCRWLTKRFREITWAKGLWDLGAEGALICPSAYKWETVEAPILDTCGNVVRYDSSRKIIYASSLDTDMIWADAAERIKNI